MISLCFADFKDFINNVLFFFTIVHITIWSEFRQLTDDEDPDLVIICHVMNSKHFNSVVSSVNPIFSTDPYFNTAKCLTFYIAFFIH